MFHFAEQPVLCAPTLEPVKNARYIHVATRGRAFTLVEMLVSMSVLVLLVAMIAQMVNNTAKVTGLSQQRLDIDSEARAVFERMAQDFNGMIRRPDVDCNVYPYDPNGSNLFKRPINSAGSGPSNTNNDYLAFISEANAVNSSTGRQTGVGDTAGIVAYRIWDNTTLTSPVFSPYFSLERFGTGFELKNPAAYRGLLFLSGMSGKPSYLAVNPQTPADITNAAKNIDLLSTLRGGMALPDPHVQNSSFHCIGEHVFRMEFGLQLKYPNPANATFKDLYYRDGLNDPAQHIQDMRDVTAIFVTIALLPGDVRIKLGNNFNTKMAKAVAALKDGNNPGIATDWENTLRTSPATTIDPLIALNARIYQRFFYLK